MEELLKIHRSKREADTEDVRSLYVAEEVKCETWWPLARS